MSWRCSRPRPRRATRRPWTRRGAGSEPRSPRCGWATRGGSHSARRAGPAPPPLDEARRRFGALLTALRLVDAAGFAFGSSAWARADAGPFQLVSLGIGGGVPRGVPYRVEVDEEDELRGFINLVARRAEDAH